MKHRRRDRRIITMCVAAASLPFLLFPVSVFAETSSDHRAPGREMAAQATQGQRSWNTVDHSKHESLNATFRSGSEITRACLSCHNDAAEQFKQTIHWTWIDPRSTEEVITGKAGHSVNNFCISANKMNDKGCSKCHTGWNGKEDGINCLVCHGTVKIDFGEIFKDYEVFADSDDASDMEIANDIQNEIQNAAQSITLPRRRNCGSCHFYGGGGDGVKHGDLDSSLTNPAKNLDVHMGKDGQNFDCVRCHTTVSHHVAGRIYSTPAATSRKSLVEDDLTSKITCVSCHTDKPHDDKKPNDHTDKVACQSCHIPTFARVNPTKMSWDWSTSGKFKDGKPYTEVGEYGKETYLSKKGDMKWEKNVKPEYFWFNGSIQTKTVKDQIDPSQVVGVSWPVGNREDENARIFPFKVHRGNQFYDKIHSRLLGPLLTGPNGYWKNYDLQDALKRGAEFLDVPYSGEYGYVETTYVYPTTHMVAPKDSVVNCTECHTRRNSRLANLAGFYMPARDSYMFLDIFGWLLAAGSLLGVMLHGRGRFITGHRAKE